MTLDEYQELAARTGARLLNGPFHEGMAILALGVAGEAGEVADAVKKVVGHGHPMDVVKLRDELGDTLWYVAVLAKHLGLSLDDVARCNVEKLLKRYPDGFTTERSLHRENP